MTLSGSPAGVRVRLCPTKRQSLSAQVLPPLSDRTFLQAPALNSQSHSLPRAPSLSLSSPLQLAKKFRNQVRLLRMCDRLRSLLKSQQGPKQELLPPGALAAPDIYVGHTRFATSSIPTEAETHPHRWSSAETVQRWGVRQNGEIGMDSATEALYVTHNGDFEFYKLWGRWGPLPPVIASSPHHCPNRQKCIQIWLMALCAYMSLGCRFGNVSNHKFRPKHDAADRKRAPSPLAGTYNSQLTPTPR